jgi:parallel beta-helix repeat protein
METKQVKVIVSVLALAMLALLSIVGQAADPQQGSPLNDDIGLHADDPRTAISSVPHTINSSGSYYLTNDLQTSSANSDAIHINADNVTLDLMGFSLIGRGSGTGIGILISGQQNVEIRNGTIRDFGGDGIYENDDEEKGGAHRVINVRVFSNGGNGIDLGGVDHLVRSSTVLGNGFGGIFVGPYSKVRECKVSTNLGHGIELGSKCTVLENVVDYNLFSGIWTWSNCVVTDNIICENYSHGILVEKDYSLIKRNTLTENLESNIFVDGSYNVIEENFVSNSVRGIRFERGGNFFANNRASGNNIDYSNTSGNADGGGNVSF